MISLQFLVPVGALEAVAPYIPFVALVLVLANMATRARAHQRHVEQAEEGDDAISRHPPHVATTVVLVVVSLAYLVVEPHSGMVLTVLVIGTFVADFFELEARKVEARNDMPIEKPKSALVGSVFVLLYASYVALFFLVQDYWNMVV